MTPDYEAPHLSVGQVEAGVARGEARVRVGVHPHDEGLLPSCGPEVRQTLTHSAATDW